MCCNSDVQGGPRKYAILGKLAVLVNCIKCARKTSIK